MAEDIYADSSVYTLDGRILESYENKEYRKYYYDRNHTVEYSITYDLNNRPLHRETETFEYYR